MTATVLSILAKAEEAARGKSAARAGSAGNVGETRP